MAVGLIVLAPLIGMCIAVVSFFGGFAILHDWWLGDE